ncbi:hypothetical protein [Litchfieldia alkalitelluris]|uniref:hypothetical protein n=1 Tax=Litchfieldia alkalitelluris TaxID=304268 RepID=UPI001473D576|nr:hypothetical protein [Litchfieldia alkalitelluris]
MVGMWLTTLVMFGFLIFGVVFIIYVLRWGIEPHDAVKIDPLPSNKNQDSPKK